MRGSDKDRWAASVARFQIDLDLALAGSRRKYPTREFQLFAEAVRSYVAATGVDPLIHREVVRAVHGLSDVLRVERRSVPPAVLLEAERLECLLFLGYDPYFEGDEPPGL